MTSPGKLIQVLRRRADHYREQASLPHRLERRDLLLMMAHSYDREAMRLSLAALRGPDAA